jgi:hypothetical protein
VSLDRLVGHRLSCGRAPSGQAFAGSWPPPWRDCVAPCRGIGAHASVGQRSSGLERGGRQRIESGDLAGADVAQRVTSRRCPASGAGASEVLVTSTVQMLILGSGITFAGRGATRSRESPTSGTCSRWSTPDRRPRAEWSPRRSAPAGSGECAHESSGQPWGMRCCCLMMQWPGPVH